MKYKENGAKMKGRTGDIFLVSLNILVMSSGKSDAFKFINEIYQNRSYFTFEFSFVLFCFQEKKKIIDIN